MFDTVPVPLWLLIVVALFAAWAALDRLLMPSVRWFFRRRVNRVLDEVRARLDVDIPHFSLTRRDALIDRLVYDPDVQRAMALRAEDEGTPREVMVDTVRRYAREIVPAFNAYVYFRIGYWFARRISRLFYRLRVGESDEGALRSIGENATPVFVINHRSNMDYVLVAFLAYERAAISYAVGEWARAWPLQPLIKLMGGFFVRRNSGDPLYRKVLERYVQMATAGGVPQAVFLEGRLSRDGRLGEPKLGLLDYILRDFDTGGERDVLLIPVGINYDRVLEDRTLQLAGRGDAPRRGKAHALRVTAGFLMKNLWLAARRRWHSFGYACVNFGDPISLGGYMRERRLNPAKLDAEKRIEAAQGLAGELMQAVAAMVPVLPVPLVAAALDGHPEGTMAERELRDETRAIMERLDDAGALRHFPGNDRESAVDEGLRLLRLRHLIEERNGLLAVPEENRGLIEYYANSIAHLVARK